MAMAAGSAVLKLALPTAAPRACVVVSQKVHFVNVTWAITDACMGIGVSGIDIGIGIGIDSGIGIGIGIGFAFGFGIGFGIGTGFGIAFRHF